MYPSQGPIRLDSDWPGLDLKPDEVRVDPDTLERVSYRLMAQHYAHMDGQTLGTLSFLGAAGLENYDHPFGFWPTAEYMERGLEQARQGLLEYYRILDEQIEAAADLFKQTAQEYRELDEGIKQELEATAEVWDRLATPADLPVAPGGAAGSFQHTTLVEGILMPEDTSNYDADWIIAQMKQLRERETWRVLSWRGDTYTQVADRLEDIADAVKSEATTLAEEWNSEASVAAQRALQRIAGTARHLSESARGVAEFVYRSADALQTAAHDFPDDTDVSWWGDVEDFFSPGSPNQEAKYREVRQKLASLNETYTHINNVELPKQISADLPVLTELPPSVDRDRDWGGGSGGIGAGGGFVPSSPPRVPMPPVGEVPPPAGGPGGASGVAQVPGQPIGADPGTGGPGGIGGLEPPGGLAPPGGLESPGGSGGGLAGATPGAVPGGIPGGVGGPGAAGPGGLGGGPGGLGPGGGLGGPGGGVAPGGGAVGPLAGGVAPGAAGGRGAGGASGLGRGAGGTGRVGGVMPVGGAGAAGTGGRGAGGRVGGAVGGGRPGAVGGAGAAGGKPGAVGGGKPGVVGGAVGGAAGSGGAVTGRGGMAGGMVPMAGAGRGGEKGHSRPDSWLVEDDDPWQVDDDVPPGVIR